MSSKSLLLLSATLGLVVGCSLARPQVRGSLSSQDVADVQADVRETTKAPLRWIEASGEDVFAYTGERMGGTVYLFKRNQAGRLEGCGCGEWDGMP
jgi:hypothetical protein